MIIVLGIWLSILLGIDVGINYKIRKLYVVLHPLLDINSCSDKVQFIMRDSPLISDGVPFFFEPWVQPDYKGKYKDKNILIEFIKELKKYVARN